METKNYSSTKNLKTSRFLQYDFKNEKFLNPVKIDNGNNAFHNNELNNFACDNLNINVIEKVDKIDKENLQNEFIFLGTNKTDPKRDSSIISIIEKNLEGIRLTDIIPNTYNLCNVDKNLDFLNTNVNKDVTRVSKNIILLDSIC